MEITSVAVVPLSDTFPEGRGLGDARGFGRDRATTLVIDVPQGPGLGVSIDEAAIGNTGSTDRDGVDKASP